MRLFWIHLQPSCLFTEPPYMDHRWNHTWISNRPLDDHSAFVSTAINDIRGNPISDGLTSSLHLLLARNSHHRPWSPSQDNMFGQLPKVHLQFLHQAYLLGWTIILGFCWCKPSFHLGCSLWANIHNSQSKRLSFIAHRHSGTWQKHRRLLLSATVHFVSTILCYHDLQGQLNHWKSNIARYQFREPASPSLSRYLLL